MDIDTLSCDICNNDYNRKLHMPLELCPCGHTLCKKCVIDWFVNNKKLTCPFCRAVITTNIVDDDILQTLPLDFNYSYTRPNELIKDNSNIAIYIINNNLKNIKDGSKIENIELCSRWTAAAHNLIEVAKYNISRGIYALYYILNPSKINYWELNKDFIIIDPLAYHKLDHLNTLIKILAAPNNSPPKTFNLIGYNIAQYLKYIIPPRTNLVISYNFITDEIPSVSKLFENSLFFLSSKYELFLSIVLYTSDPKISMYYNKLSTLLSNRFTEPLIYVDIIRDYFIDAALFYKSQRKIVLYSKKLHIARMAGCYSPCIYNCTVAKLSSTNLCILIKNLLNIPRQTSFLLPRDNGNFMSYVYRNNYYVLNILTDKHRFIINTKLLSLKINGIQYRHTLRDVFIRSRYNSIKLV